MCVDVVCRSAAGQPGQHAELVDEAGSDEAGVTAAGRADVHRWSHCNMLLMLNYHLPDKISVVMRVMAEVAAVTRLSPGCHQAVGDGPAGGLGEALATLPA